MGSGSSPSGWRGLSTDRVSISHSPFAPGSPSDGDDPSDVAGPGPPGDVGASVTPLVVPAAVNGRPGGDAAVSPAGADSGCVLAAAEGGASARAFAIG